MPRAVSPHAPAALGYCARPARSEFIAGENRVAVPKHEMIDQRAYLKRTPTVGEESANKGKFALVSPNSLC